MLELKEQRAKSRIPNPEFGLTLVTLSQGKQLAFLSGASVPTDGGSLEFSPKSKVQSPKRVAVSG